MHVHADPANQFPRTDGAYAVRPLVLFAAAALAGCVHPLYRGLDTAATEAALQGSWSAVSLDGKTIPPRVLTLQFSGAQVKGTIACNAFEGVYRINAGRIVFGDAGLTALGCGTPTTAAEKVVEQILFPDVEARIGSHGELHLITDGHSVELSKAR